MDNSENFLQLFIEMSNLHISVNNQAKPLQLVAVSSEEVSVEVLSLSEDSLLCLPSSIAALWCFVMTVSPLETSYRKGTMEALFVLFGFV